ALSLEGHAQLGVDLDESPGDAVPHCPRLARDAAAMDADAKVVGPARACDVERRKNHSPMARSREVLLERASVDPRLPVAWAKDHAGNRRLTLSGPEVLRELAHVRSFEPTPLESSRVFGAWASCGCSGPA